MPQKPVEEQEQDYSSWEKSRNKKLQGDNRGELESVRIERAENGFTVYTNYRPKPQRSSKGMNMCCSYPEPEKAVFNSPDEMFAYIGSVLGVKKG